MDIVKRPPACFAGGTLVCLPDGSMLPIQNIRVASKLATYSGGNASVAAVLTRRLTGTVLTLSVMGPYGKMKVSPFQPMAYYPLIDDLDASNRYDMVWTPAGQLARGNKVLLPWITANKTKFFDEILKPNNASGITVPSGIVQSCPHGLICPVLAIAVHEVVDEKHYSLSVLGDNTFIANGVAVSGS